MITSDQLPGKRFLLSEREVGTCRGSRSASSVGGNGKTIQLPPQYTSGSIRACNLPLGEGSFRNLKLLVEYDLTGDIEELKLNKLRRQLLVENLLVEIPNSSKRFPALVFKPLFDAVDGDYVHVQYFGTRKVEKISKFSICPFKFKELKRECEVPFIADDFATWLRVTKTQLIFLKGPFAISPCTIEVYDLKKTGKCQVMLVQHDTFNRTLNVMDSGSLNSFTIDPRLSQVNFICSDEDLDQMLIGNAPKVKKHFSRHSKDSQKGQIQKESQNATQWKPPAWMASPEGYLQLINSLKEKDRVKASVIKVNPRKLRSSRSSCSSQSSRSSSSSISSVGQRKNASSRADSFDNDYLESASPYSGVNECKDELRASRLLRFLEINDDKTEKPSRLLRFFKISDSSGIKQPRTNDEDRLSMQSEDITDQRMKEEQYALDALLEDDVFIETNDEGNDKVNYYEPDAEQDNHKQNEPDQNSIELAGDLVQEHAPQNHIFLPPSQLNELSLKSSDNESLCETNMMFDEKLFKMKGDLHNNEHDPFATSRMLCLPQHVKDVKLKVVSSSCGYSSVEGSHSLNCRNGMKTSIHSDANVCCTSKKTSIHSDANVCCTSKKTSNHSDANVCCTSKKTSNHSDANVCCTSKQHSSVVMTCDVAESLERKILGDNKCENQEHCSTLTNEPKIDMTSLVKKKFNLIHFSSVATENKDCDPVPGDCSLITKENVICESSNPSVLTESNGKLSDKIQTTIFNSDTIKLATPNKTCSPDYCQINAAKIASSVKPMNQLDMLSILYDHGEQSLSSSSNSSTPTKEEASLEKSVHKGLSTLVEKHTTSEKAITNTATQRPLPGAKLTKPVHSKQCKSSQSNPDLRMTASTKYTTEITESTVEYPPITHKSTVEYPPITHKSTVEYPPITHKSTVEYPPITHKSTVEYPPPITHKSTVEYLPPITHKNTVEYPPPITHKRDIESAVTKVYGKTIIKHIFSEEIKFKQLSKISDQLSNLTDKSREAKQRLSSFQKRSNPKVHVTLSPENIKSILEDKKNENFPSCPGKHVLKQNVNAHTAGSITRATKQEVIGVEIVATDIISHTPKTTADTHKMVSIDSVGKKDVSKCATTDVTRKRNAHRHSSGGSRDAMDEKSTSPSNEHPNTALSFKNMARKNYNRLLDAEYTSMNLNSSYWKHDETCSRKNYDESQMAMHNCPNSQMNQSTSYEQQVVLETNELLKVMATKKGLTTYEYESIGCLQAFLLLNKCTTKYLESELMELSNKSFKKEGDMERLKARLKTLLFVSKLPVLQYDGNMDISIDAPNLKWDFIYNRLTAFVANCKQELHTRQMSCAYSHTQQQLYNASIEFQEQNAHQLNIQHMGQHFGVSANQINQQFNYNNINYFSQMMQQPSCYASLGPSQLPHNMSYRQTEQYGMPSHNYSMPCDIYNNQFYGRSMSDSTTDMQQSTPKQHSIDYHGLNAILPDGYHVPEGGSETVPTGCKQMVSNMPVSASTANTQQNYKLAYSDQKVVSVTHNIGGISDQYKKIMSHSSTLHTAGSPTTSPFEKVRRQQLNYEDNEASRKKMQSVKTLICPIVEQSTMSITPPCTSHVDEVSNAFIDLNTPVHDAFLESLLEKCPLSHHSNNSNSLTPMLENILLSTVGDSSESNKHKIKTNVDKETSHASKKSNSVSVIISTSMSKPEVTVSKTTKDFNVVTKSEPVSLGAPVQMVVTKTAITSSCNVSDVVCAYNEALIWQQQNYSSSVSNDVMKNICHTTESLKMNPICTTMVNHYQHPAYKFGDNLSSYEPKFSESDKSMGNSGLQSTNTDYENTMLPTIFTKEVVKPVSDKLPISELKHRKVLLKHQSKRYASVGIVPTLRNQSEPLNGLNIDCSHMDISENSIASEIVSKSNKSYIDCTNKTDTMRQSSNQVEIEDMEKKYSDVVSQYMMQLMQENVKPKRWSSKSSTFLPGKTQDIVMPAMMSTVQRSQPSLTVSTQHMYVNSQKDFDLCITQNTKNLRKSVNLEKNTAHQNHINHHKVSSHLTTTLPKLTDIGNCVSVKPHDHLSVHSIKFPKNQTSRLKKLIQIKDPIYEAYYNKIKKKSKKAFVHPTCTTVVDSSVTTVTNRPRCVKVLEVIESPDDLMNMMYHPRTSSQTAFTKIMNVTTTNKSNLNVTSKPSEKLLSTGLTLTKYRGHIIGSTKISCSNVTSTHQISPSIFKSNANKASPRQVKSTICYPRQIQSTSKSTSFLIHNILSPTGEWSPHRSTQQERVTSNIYHPFVQCIMSSSIHPAENQEVNNSGQLGKDVEQLNITTAKVCERLSTTLCDVLPAVCSPKYVSSHTATRSDYRDIKIVDNLMKKHSKPVNTTISSTIDTYLTTRTVSPVISSAIVTKAEIKQVTTSDKTVSIEPSSDKQLIMPTLPNFVLSPSFSIKNHSFTYDNVKLTGTSPLSTTFPVSKTVTCDFPQLISQKDLNDVVNLVTTSHVPDIPSSDNSVFSLISEVVDKPGFSDQSLCSPPTSLITSLAGNNVKSLVEKGIKFVLKSSVVSSSPVLSTPTTSSGYEIRLLSLPGLPTKKTFNAPSIFLNQLQCKHTTSMTNSVNQSVTTPVFSAVQIVNPSAIKLPGNVPKLQVPHSDASSIVLTAAKTLSADGIMIKSSIRKMSKHNKDNRNRKKRSNLDDMFEQSTPGNKIRRSSRSIASDTQWKMHQCQVAEEDGEEETESMKVNLSVTGRIENKDTVATMKHCNNNQTTIPKALLSAKSVCPLSIYQKDYNIDQHLNNMKKESNTGIKSSPQLSLPVSPAKHLLVRSDIEKTITTNLFSNPVKKSEGMVRWTTSSPTSPVPFPVPSGVNHVYLPANVIEKFKDNKVKCQYIDEKIYLKALKSMSSPSATSISTGNAQEDNYTTFTAHTMQHTTTTKVKTVGSNQASVAKVMRSTSTVVNSKSSLQPHITNTEKTHNPNQVISALVSQFRSIYGDKFAGFDIYESNGNKYLRIKETSTNDNMPISNTIISNVISSLNAQVSSTNVVKPAIDVSSSPINSKKNVTSPFKVILTDFRKPVPKENITLSQSITNTIHKNKWKSKKNKFWYPEDHDKDKNDSKEEVLSVNIGEMVKAKSRKRMKKVLTDEGVNKKKLRSSQVGQKSWLQTTTCDNFPKLPKCIDCKEENDDAYCRFTMFRRLVTTDSGRVKAAGFCTADAAEEEDLTHWVFNSNTKLDVDVSTQVLRDVGMQFQQLVLQEIKAQKWGGKTGENAWKRAVLRVREMCDICATTIFNTHWTCDKCGFGVCLDCFRSALDQRKGKENTNFLDWPLCDAGDEHNVNLLTVTEIIPKDVLLNLHEDMLRVCKQIGLKFRQLDLLEFSHHRNYGDVQKAIEPLTSNLDILATVANFEQDQCMVEAGKRNIFDSYETREQQAESECAWYCDGRILHIQNAKFSHETMKLFKSEWLKGNPVIVSNVHHNLNEKLWNPDAFQKDFGEEKSDIINCYDGTVIENFEISRFWKGFECVTERPVFPSDSDQPVSLLKLKDWPPGDDFKEKLPARFNDMMQALPAQSYTNRTGELNLASRLPSFFAVPDLGPKMYNAYGSASYPSAGTTNLHLDISDATNVICYVGIPIEEDVRERENHDTLATVDRACCEATKRRIQDSNVKPGALWHIFPAHSAEKIRCFLRRIAEERGLVLNDTSDAIHDQSFYLDQNLLERLREEEGVVGYAICQCLGDAVFIPAGAPHQVLNLHSCIKVAEDFVAPEHITHCFQLTQEFRHLSDYHTNHEDKLQIKNIIFHSVKDCLGVVKKHFNL